MLYGFSIAPSINTNEPGALYFASLERNAAATLVAPELSFSSANALCEYLDCVDSGDLKSNKPLYRQAVDALTDYLNSNQDSSDAQALDRKSWAAKTLLELVRAVKMKKTVTRSFHVN